MGKNKRRNRKGHHKPTAPKGPADSLSKPSAGLSAAPGSADSGAKDAARSPTLPASQPDASTPTPPAVHKPPRSEPDGKLPVTAFLRNPIVQGVIAAGICVLLGWAASAIFKLPSKQQMQLTAGALFLVGLLAAVERYLLSPIGKTHRRRALLLLGVFCVLFVIIAVLGVSLATVYNELKYAKVRYARHDDGSNSEAIAQGQAVYAICDSLRPRYILRDADVDTLRLTFILIGPNGRKEQHLAGRYDLKAAPSGYGTIWGLAGSENSLAEAPDRHVSIVSRLRPTDRPMPCPFVTDTQRVSGVTALLCQSTVPLRADGFFSVDMCFSWPHSVPRATDFFFADLLTYPRLHGDVLVTLYSDVPVAAYAWLVRKSGANVVADPLDPERFVTTNLSVPASAESLGARHASQLVLKPSEVQSLLMLQVMRNPRAIRE